MVNAELTALEDEKGYDLGLLFLHQGPLQSDVGVLRDATLVPFLVQREQLL